MQLTSTLDFAADPATVIAMFLDEDYLHAVCEASHSLEHTVSVDGRTSHTSRKLSAPDAAKAFTGDTITITEQTTWSEVDGAGDATGVLKMGSPGLPVTMKGEARIRKGGRGTLVTYDADLKVNVPLVGKKLEQSAAPALLRAIEIQQEVGDHFLTKA